MCKNGVRDLHSSKQTPARNASPPKTVHSISGWEWQGCKHLIEEYKRLDTKVKNLQPKASEKQ